MPCGSQSGKATRHLAAGRSPLGDGRARKVLGALDESIAEILRSVMRQSVPTLLPLFRSEAQVRMLLLLFTDPTKAWSATELAERVGAPRPSTQRELQRARAAGIVVRDETARPFRYAADTRSPAFSPLQQLLDLSAGVSLELEALLESTPGVAAAALHGSWVSGPIRGDSDVDLLVVGDVNYPELRAAVRRVERTTGRHIDLMAYRPAEFRALVEAKNGFVREILAGERQDLIGSLDDVLA